MLKVLTDFIVLGTFLIFDVPDWLIYFMMFLSFAWAYGKIGHKPSTSF